ncbi:outer dense fiber protein 2 isoform X2 [Bombina bombina]|uniref:outer dense fiber protein 2 isoform X2 n=1 Tax=Bombina bombina TaxID=8345 RepID=UPI00235B1108|nr:outer dense fiber protein 2 isoform X2 [Bombina bombina]
MKNRSPTPPLHVHVDESTPVHVHIKKSPKISSKMLHKGTKSKMKGDTGNLRRSAKVKTRVPWIPPGKASLRDSGFKWEGLTHRLEITPPDTDKMFSALRLSDLSTDEEETLRSKINSYEKKIDSLMNEVGTLKNEVELHRKDNVLERCEEQLAVSKRLLESQKEELAEVSLELVETETENTRLRRSIDRIKEEKGLSVLQKQQLLEEKSQLLDKLLEAEMDGSEAAKQVNVLRDTIHRMKHEKRMTSTDINLLTRQKEILLQKLATFEDTNRKLRSLLKEQHASETESYRLLEQKDLLLKKLSETDTDKMHLQMRLQDREKEIEDLHIQLQTEKDLARTASEFSKSLEVTKAHLQGQLRSREAENNRLCVQIRNLERSEAQQKAELEQLMQQMSETRNKTDFDKEALKKSVRAQKQRAERQEEALQVLNTELRDKDAELSKSLSAIDTWKSRYNALMKEKSQVEDEMVTLNNHVTVLAGDKRSAEEKARLERESLLDKLHRQTAENTSLRVEHETLKTNLATLEEKLTLAHSEVQQLKGTLRQYEGLVDTYKEQVQKTRKEADEICLQLERSVSENKNLKDEMNRDMEQVRKKFHYRLSELEQLPEMLRITEMKLQECQEQLHEYENKNSELTSIISDLRVRMEQQGDKMESTRDRYQSATEENKLLVLRLEELERKLEDATTQNRELMQVVAKREDSIHQNQLRLEEKSRECASLARQLEAAIEDSRRQVDQTRERASSKERITQSKILDLETQLSKTKTELNQFRRTKDDAERRFQSRLQDLKDRLEQSESTNRSMQNYVQFLKSSYANVFGEAAVSSSPIRPRTPL